MKNGRINIGIMVNSIQNDYSTLMCQGAAVAAEELDANLLIIPGRELNAHWDNIEINRFECQSNVLYSYVTPSNIDVLLVSTGTVGFFLDYEHKKEFLERFKGIKVIALETRIDGFPSITFSLDGLREAIEHIINVHGKRKIAFLSGPRENSAAAERLELFRQIMKENGIEYDEKYIAYGDFTDYCEPVIEQFFDDCADDMPEAVCCANDSMVKSLKNVCVSRGIRIGQDLLVTGYDNAAFANVMVPPLTTVKSNIMTMGYRAVECAVEYHRTGVLEDQYVSTSLIVRQSCGCNPEAVRATETKGISYEYEKNQLADNIVSYIIKKSSLDIMPLSQVQALKKFIYKAYERFSEGKTFSSDEVSDMIEELMSDENMDFLTFDAINALMYALRKLALERAGDSNGVEQVYAVFERIFRYISLQFAEKSNSIENRMISDRFVFSRIADDMMDSGNDEAEALRLLMNDISLLHVKSCYIYLYHSSFFEISGEKVKMEDWKRPQHIYLKAVYENGKYVFPHPRDQRMQYDNFISHKFMPHGQRRTTVLQALYFNDEQYGIILLETSIGFLSEIMNISKQICTAIKLTQFMNQLEGALDDVRRANIRLSAESVTDQLTNVYNRRGFISESEKILRRFYGRHCSGAVLYADLDCLKTINDTFGHKEGDFAIRKVSELLTGSLRSSDVVGRVGGDEFVAFIMDIEKEQLDAICRRIRDSAAQFNAESDKPYNIGVSMGIYFFDTFDGETIDQLMSGADRDLYSSKQKKNRSVLKNPQN